MKAKMEMQPNRNLMGDGGQNLDSSVRSLVLNCKNARQWCAGVLEMFFCEWRCADFRKQVERSSEDVTQWRILAVFNCYRLL